MFSVLPAPDSPVVVTCLHHALVGSLSNIQLYGAEGVDGDSLVRVVSNAEETRVGVDELVLVADNRVP